MSVTTFRFPRAGLEALLFLSAAGSVAAMFFVHSWEEIPFHLVWLSMTAAYGFRAWSAGKTILLVALVALVTGAAFGRAVIQGGAGVDELAEVPLLAGIFSVM